jgi:hypothetical protein
MGLSVRETKAYVEGSTEKKNPLRLAVANDLRFGTARLRNVVFLVLSDKALYIGPLKHQMSGILGLPIIRALGRVEVSAKGSVRVEAKAPEVQGEPNLFFEGSNPVVETRHGDHRVQMLLDTGANATVVYPSFRDAMEKDEIARLKSKRGESAGAGGVVRRKTEVIPALRLEVLGRPVNLAKVVLLPDQPSGDTRRLEGLLGMDGMANGFTLDFRVMQLTIQ